MIVLVAALLILGPKKLPDAARQVGKAVSEFRRMANGFQSDIKEAFSEDTGPPRYHSPVPPTALEPPPSYGEKQTPMEPPPPAEGPENDTPLPSSAEASWPAAPADAELPAPPEDPTRN